VSHKRYKALFINSGILGHNSVFKLLRESTARDSELEAVHINLNDDLTTKDRIIRRAFCFRCFGRTKLSQLNLDFARWRQELHAGVLAARRIRACERSGTRFDVLHFHTQATAYASLRRMKRTPSIVSIDCTQGLAREEASSRLAKSTYLPNIAHDGAVFRAASAIISISRWAANDLARAYPDCADKVHVMPYPVRLESFAEEWIQERHTHSMSDSDARVRVLFMGGDFNRKGGRELLAAWREGSFAKDAVLDLVTDWPITENELPSGVNLIRNVAPFTPQWSELWRRADIFAMPTRSEAFGMVYQEAAAAGIPSIGSSLNAIPEIIEDGVTGLLVPPGDVSQLVPALRTLVQSTELRRRFGTAARKRIEKSGCPEDYSKKLTSLIKQLARRNL
jgi:starch synthase